MLASALPDDPYLQSVLTDYFPEPLREKFADQMRAHPLRREIITTEVVNDMVDRSGTTFLFRMNEETGASVPDITCAWLVARRVFDLPGFWAQVEALDGQVDVATQLALLLEGHKLAERATRWLLYNRRPPFDIAETIDFFSGGVLTVSSGLPKLLTGRDRSGFDDRLESFTARGVPAELAERVAAMVPAYSAFDLVEIAAATGRSMEETAEVYFDLAERLQIARLRDRITALPRDDRWNTMARGRAPRRPVRGARGHHPGRAPGDRPGQPRGAARRLGPAQRVGGQRAGADADRDLGERPVHCRDAVGGGACHPHAGGRQFAAGTSVISHGA